MSTFQAFERVLILAVESCTWDMLLPFVQDGAMSALGAFLKRANYGVLESSTPSHTAAAWATFLTGKDAGHHGVIDFVRFDPAQQRSKFQDSSVTHPDSVLARLSNAGITCGSLFLPRHYPPPPFKNGYVVSGFETPGEDAAFTYPLELRDEVLGISPELHFNVDDMWIDSKSDEDFSKNIDRIIASVDLLEHMAVHCQRERPVRVQISYLQATDILFQKAWRWCDPKTAHDNPQRHELVRKFFRRIDSMFNRIFGLHSSASQRMRPGGSGKTLRLLCSAHGHRHSRGRVFVNSLLEEWGYLKQLSGLGRASRRLRLLTTFDPLVRTTRSRELSLDWSQTRAYMPHAANCGFIYINLKGREPKGIVTAEEFDAERDELIDRLMHQKIPRTDKPLFTKVWKGEDLFARKVELDLPDLVVQPAEGFHPRKALTTGDSITHASKAPGGVPFHEGIYAFEGNGITPSLGLGERLNIVDLAPTLLLGLGQPIPKGMTGKAAPRLFDPPAPTKFIDDAGTTAARTTSPFSQEEEEAMARRLWDLGYFE